MSKLAQDIKKIKAAIASPATPDNIKETMKKKLVELEAKLAEESHQPDNEKKIDSPARKTDENDLDCEELIAKAKASAAKRKASRQKADKKPESRKNVERVEKAAETVVSSIEKRMEAGEKVNASEIEKLIVEYEANITELKRLLAKLK